MKREHAIGIAVLAGLAVAAIVDALPAESAQAEEIILGYDGPYTTVVRRYGVIQGSAHTASASGTVSYIRAYIWVMIDRTEKFRAAIYENAGDRWTYLGASTWQTISAPRWPSDHFSDWVTFPLLFSKEIHAGQEYLLVVWQETGEGGVYFAYEEGAGRHIYCDWRNGWIVNPFPAEIIAPTVNNSKYLIYTSYVSNRPPACSITAPPDGSRFHVGDGIQFACTASDPDGDPITYLWQFGDGATSTSPAPTHAYASASTYGVLLTVSDGALTGSDSITLHIDEPPEEPPEPEGNETYRYLMAYWWLLALVAVLAVMVIINNIRSER